MPLRGEKKICPEGHTYYKSSDCPLCPVCESRRKPETGFLSELSAPARRALEAENITTLSALSKHSVSEILELHGMGPKSIPQLKASLEEAGLGFRPD